MLERVAEALFPYIGLPMALLLLMAGGMISWDLLAGYGKAHGPDALARKGSFYAWMFDQARGGEKKRPASNGVMWRRLLILLPSGAAILAYWLTVVL